MRILAKIRMIFCSHVWKLTKFQALVGGRSYECTKCGKRAYDD